MDAEEWPEAPEAISVRPADDRFITAFRSLIPFASTDPSRTVLNGIALQLGRGYHNLTATDGRRLCTFSDFEFPKERTDPAIEPCLSEAMRGLQNRTSKGRVPVAGPVLQFPQPNQNMCGIFHDKYSALNFCYSYMNHTIFLRDCKDSPAISTGPADSPLIGSGLLLIHKAANPYPVTVFG